MRVRLGSVFCVMVVAGAAMVAVPMAKAQEQTAHNGPSKYLYLSSLSVKPGATGQFLKLQQEEIAALRAAKAPGHFVTMEQITGSNLLVTLAGFDSFADMQKMHKATWSNKQLAATLRTDNESQGALTREERDSIYVFRKNLSLHANQSLADMRFMRIWVVKVKPGHDEEFESLAKAEAKAHGGNADMHWAVFEKMYGQGGSSVYMVATPMKSLGDLDTMVANRQKRQDEAGAGLNHLATWAEGNSVSMSESDLFVFAPRMSYVSGAWLSASPDFWGEK